MRGSSGQGMEGVRDENENEGTTVTCVRDLSSDESESVAGAHDDATAPCKLTFDFDGGGDVLRKCDSGWAVRVMRRGRDLHWLLVFID